MNQVKTVHLAIGIHNHQPVGNFSGVFEDLYQAAYDPFLKILARHPHIKVSMHFSGLLLQWLREKHPNYTTKLKEMNTKGQIELLTGGFYEPILSAIPDRDKIGQIGKLTKYIEEYFSFSPKGMWLTERVWEPHLAKSISESGVEFTFLDECQFKTGFLTKKEDVYGYYVTEEQGSSLALFPIHHELRHAIPFKSVTEVLEIIKNASSEEGNNLIAFCDDGEKFGGWPGTFKNVYEKNWLEKFFEKLEDSPMIKMTTFSEYRRKYPPKGRIYIPATSYPEMMEWAVPTSFQKTYLHLLRSAKDENKPLIRGGMWRNFLVKYVEANNLHKKALYVSAKTEKVKELEIKTRAQEDLWKGQANDAYWHGVFGGIYLPHLRSSVYHHLIKSEYLVDMYLHRNGPWLDVEITDFNKDLMDEVLINTDKLNIYLIPVQGGQIFELDYKLKACNFQGLISRKEELYHEQVGKVASHETGKSIHEIRGSKERGLDKFLHYDWYPRYSLIDHFFHPDTKFSDFTDAKYGEQGDFVNQPYHFDVERNHEQAVIKLWRDGHVWVGKDFQPIRIEKKVVIFKGQSSFQVEFHLFNGSNQNLPLWFGSELSFQIASSADPGSGALIEGKNANFSEIVESREVSHLLLRDGVRKTEISLAFSKSSGLWMFPLYTISQSESGFEKIFQGTIVVPNWRITLGPKGTWKTVVSYSFKEL